MELNTKLRILNKQFFINEERGIVTCKITVLPPDNYCGCGCDAVEIIGQAKLFPGDVWDEQTGRLIAERKAIVSGLKLMLSIVRDKKRKMARDWEVLSDAEEIFEDKLTNAKIDLMHRTGGFERLNFILSGEFWKQLEAGQVPDLDFSKEEI